MRGATRVTVGAFGALAVLMGIEHGIGEILQGSVAPDGVVIESWPGSEFFSILGGEPAMTVVPNLLVTGLARDSQRQADPRQAASRGKQGGRGRTSPRHARPRLT